MGKVKTKEQDNGIPKGMQAKDLSLEKRIELYKTALREFDANASETFGVSVSVELRYTPQGITPQMVLVDLLANKKNDKKPETTEKPAQA